MTTKGLDLRLPAKVVSYLVEVYVGMLLKAVSMQECMESFLCVCLRSKIVLFVSNANVYKDA